MWCYIKFSVISDCLSLSFSVKLYNKVICCSYLPLVVCYGDGNMRLLIGNYQFLVVILENLLRNSKLLLIKIIKNIKIQAYERSIEFLYSLHFRYFSCSTFCCYSIIFTVLQPPLENSIICPCF